MRHLLSIYVAQFKTALAFNLQYRAALVIWLLGMVLQPLIYLVVWSTVAKSGGGTVGGFSGQDFAAYFIAAMLVNHATFDWHMWDFEFRIRQGLFSPLLLKPVHPIHDDLADNVCYKLLTLPVIILAAIFLTVAFHAEIHPQPWQVALFVPALLLAFLMRFLIEWTVALAAFWTTRVSAINQAYLVAVLFLSGQLAPVSLLPAGLRTLAEALPFKWMIAFPVELLLGRLGWDEALTGLAMQMLWLGAGLAMLALVWRRGVRRYSAAGA